jgi:predicted nucleic acid-binding protein
MQKIHVDADVLIALSKEFDSNHDKAVAISKSFKDKKVVFYVSPFAIPEAATALSYDIGQTYANEFLISIRKQNFEELNFTKEVRLATDKIFLAQAKNGTSWFDCANVALYYSYEFDAIFSFDKFYIRSGLKILES